MCIRDRPSGKPSLRLNGAAKRIAEELGVNNISLTTVSYTHLDVYKRQVVWPVSSNVQLPVLPDARMDTRKEIGSLSQAPRCEELRAGTAKMMANCDAHVNNSNSGDELKNKLIAGELVAVEVADDGSSDAVGLEKFLGLSLIHI